MLALEYTAGIFMVILLLGTRLLQMIQKNLLRKEVRVKSFI
jgi:hypothetical protein